jgi:hypothetical protein
MRKITLNNTAAYVIVLVFLALVFYMASGLVREIPSAKEGENEKYISGVITDVDGGCAADAWCLIEVDDEYWIIHNPGLVRERLPIGQIEGPLVVGLKVQAYARKHLEDQDTSYQNLYTIIGNQKYYIKTAENPTEYKNDELGFSFISPVGNIYQNTNRIYEDALNFVDTEYPFITDGDTGKSFRANIPNTYTTFYFAGMTPDYTAGRDRDCGEQSSVEGYNLVAEKYGERVNAVGTKYVYSDVIQTELEGPHQVAYFKLKRGPFPVLGFCALEGMPEGEFKEVIDTVKIF